MEKQKQPRQDNQSIRWNFLDGREIERYILELQLKIYEVAKDAKHRSRILH